MEDEMEPGTQSRITGMYRGLGRLVLLGYRVWVSKPRVYSF